jgi:hypothetical protein
MENEKTYQKIVDGEGNVTTLLIQNENNVNIVTPDGVQIVGTVEDAQASIGGTYSEIQGDEYDAIFATWKGKANANNANADPATLGAAEDNKGSGMFNALGAALGSVFGSGDGGAESAASAVDPVAAANDKAAEQG